MIEMILSFWLQRNYCRGSGLVSKMGRDDDMYAEKVPLG